MSIQPRAQLRRPCQIPSEVRHRDVYLQINGEKAAWRKFGRGCEPTPEDNRDQLEHRPALKTRGASHEIRYAPS